ncbi:ABC transporter permease subunit [Xinfangfangia sp. CPCC 101601]|uniref:ABC transporter permease subunit n=1 Tax=Pseudogemmobacter lacusdianii TaxID=3069608 RepID=A0ABU0W194_9RHOB|nr:ABC transporter permease subunit [Xinfangfangia sp. CPCC 101601]MDQ2067757.1 ABC transporter permease subunit [Xinfangfangia sp. CPCC 101601]
MQRALGDAAPVASRRIAGRNPFVRWLSDWGPALPIIVISATLLILPCLIMVRRSFAGPEGTGFTLDNWQSVLASASAWRAIGNTVMLAATVATVATLVGGPLCWMLTRMTRGWRTLHMGLLTVANNFSGIGLAFGFMAALGTYGMITLGLRSMGFDFTPPVPSGFVGLVIAYSYGFVPMYVLLTLPAMGLVRQDWWEACQCCGASRPEFWRYVGLPMLLPYLGAGWILTFTSAIGQYALPLALSNSSMPAYPLITLDMSRNMLGSLFGSQRMPVMAVILMIFAIVSLLAYRQLLKRGAKWL